MGHLILLLIIVLASSAICSMVEAAVLSISSVKVRILHENKRKGSADLLKIKDNIHMAVATIVIINNSINIIGSIFLAKMVTNMFGMQWLGIASAALTLAIITFSEIIPKTIGEHYKITVSLMSAKILRFVMMLFKPLVSTIVFVTTSVKKRSTIPKITEEEIKMMLKLGQKEGTVEVNEEALCNRVFKLNDLRAHQMMRPLENVYALSGDKKLIDVKNEIIESPYSRIVVYNKETQANIVGICQQRELLRELSKDNYEAAVKDFMTAPIYVNEEERADTLLEKFQASRQHLFIVRNREGRNSGVISMEDVLEELFGEIYDEKDNVIKK